MFKMGHGIPRFLAVALLLPMLPLAYPRVGELRPSKVAVKSCVPRVSGRDNRRCGWARVTSTACRAAR